MVYLTFTSNLTEEESMLQAKYQKLKKKKKALQAHKAPKQEPEKPLVPKRVDARDAREVARKLFKSGAIPAIQKPQSKQDQVSFKRPKGQERKRPAVEPVQYQPFSATHSTESFSAASDAAETEGYRVSNLYQQFASERDREERGLNDRKTDSTSQRPDKQRTGQTICVSGNGVNEEYLRDNFSAFGQIVNISTEIEKGRGFVTFSKIESAEKSITEMHSRLIAGISLQVQFARRQPQIQPINNASSSAPWSCISANNSQKGGNLKETRELVSYEDGNIF